jgi:hypothetical protein
MKPKIFSFVTATAVIAVFFISALSGCKKSNSNSNSAALSASVNGTAFQPSIQQGFLFTSNHYFALAGGQIKAGDSLVLEVDLPDAVKVNQVFSLSDISAAALYYYDSKGNLNYAATSGVGTGSITVTAWDSVGHKIAGTFSGKLENIGNGTDTVVVSNGQFNSSYTVTP